MSFKEFDIMEAILDQLREEYSEGELPQVLLSLTLHTSELELAEEFAEQQGLIACEDELSEKFDERILPGILAAYGPDDQCAIDQAFKDWTDNLCTDGLLHSSQYQEYTYVGTHAEHRRREND